MIRRLLLLRILAPTILVAAGCQLDSGSFGDGAPPVLGTTGSMTTSGPGETSADDTGDTGDTGPLTGPRKRRIDIDPAFAGTETGGVTLLVTLDLTRIEYEDTMPGGADLRFFGPDETVARPIEIEHWDPAGSSYVWVWIEASPLPDHLWMYYGDGEAFAEGDSGLVWDDDFAAVWHMVRDGGSSLPDSTRHGLDLSPFNVAEPLLDVEGRIGLAAEMAPPPMATEQGPLDLSSGEALAFTEAVTIEAWVSPTVAMDSATHLVLRKGAAYELRTLDPTSTRPTLAIRTEGGGGQHRVEAGASAPMGQWTYVAGTYDAASGRMEIYRNGTSEASFVVPGEEAAQRALVLDDAVAKVGRDMQAVLDEVRVSSVARSPEWIALQWASMSDSLLTFRAPQARD